MMGFSFFSLVLVLLWGLFLLVLIGGAVLVLCVMSRPASPREPRRPTAR